MNLSIINFPTNTLPRNVDFHIIVSGSERTFENLQQEIPFLDSEKADSLNGALLQRYGVRRSETIDSTRLASVSVGEEHYRSFAPVTGDCHRKLAEMSCDEEVVNEWCTR